MYRTLISDSSAHASQTEGATWSREVREVANGSEEPKIPDVGADKKSGRLLFF